MQTYARRQIVLAIHYAFLTVPLLITLTGCDTAVRTASRETKPLAFVGQVQLGQPMLEGGRVVVPLKYQGDQWGQNSAIVASDVESAVKNWEIELTVVTSVATNTKANDGHKLVLPKDTKGEYKVFYLDPDGTRHELQGLEINH